MSKAQVIDRPTAARMIQKVDHHHIFKVVFRKRSTGQFRRMICRKGVTAHLKGGPQAYNPASYNLVCVFDMTKQAYRSINLETLHVIRMGGVTYRVQV